MPSREETSTLLDRLETILGRLEVSMPVWNDGTALLVQLESTLQRLGKADLLARPNCAARLEAVAAQGQQLNKHLSDVLKAVDGLT